MRTLKTLPLLISSILASGCMENNMHLIGNPPGDLPELEDCLLYTSPSPRD